MPLSVRGRPRCAHATFNTWPVLCQFSSQRRIDRLENPVALEFSWLVIVADMTHTSSFRSLEMCRQLPQAIASIQREGNTDGSERVS
jgi:hypothetical protein